MGNFIRFILIAIPFLLSACQNTNKTGKNEKGDTLHLDYAKNLTIVRYSNYTEVEILDPWHKGKTLHSYLLVNDANAAPANGNGTDATVVHVPLKHSLVSTSVHTALAMRLGKGDAVSAVLDGQYIISKQIKDRIKQGKITDCGNSMAPNIEQIINLAPDAIFLSPMQNSGGYGKMENLNIPIIELADYMEPTALGRAEWVKLYGLLFGAEDKAQEMFKETESKYLQLKSLAMKAQTKPLVLMDKAENGVWLMPGGESTISQMILDTNARYIYAGDKTTGSIQKSPESAVSDGENADVWLMRYYKNDGTPLSLKELLNENKGYSFIKAFKNGNVYGCNTATSTFFEDTPFQPELLLRDFIIAIHPELHISGKMNYFVKLK